MKKFLKVFIIVLLVIASVAVTAFFFYKNLFKDKQQEVSVIAFAQDESVNEFISDLKQTNSNYINKDSSDSRFTTAFKVINNLDAAMETVATYYVDNEIVKDKELASMVANVKHAVNLGNDMIEEYTIKASFVSKNGVSYFNRHLGANDLFKTTANYIVNYSNVIIKLNSLISSVDKQVDVKFALIDAYANVCITSYNNLQTNTNSWVVLKDSSNINMFNLIVGTSLSETICYNINANNFIKFYNSCDRVLFAKNLVSNINSVSVLTDDLTNEQIATFYFKKVYNL